MWIHETRPIAGATATREHPTLGAQIVLDLYDCETPHLDDLPWMELTMLNAARAARATIVESVFHRFSPWGISGMVIISESHLAVHAWPERRYAAIDVFTCGDTIQPDVAVRYLVKAFGSRRPVERSLTRGDDALGRAA
jgi:S-adenosylmethionine decarboxylase proenzyme